MAYIIKSDIADGNIIVADMLKRIIEALDGTRNTDIKITGELQINGQKLTIDNTIVEATAQDINGLANRTAGITEANKPLIAGNNKDLDYLKVEQLQVSELIMETPSVAESMAKIYAYNNFY